MPISILVALTFFLLKSLYVLFFTFDFDLFFFVFGLKCFFT